jgi:hypothetical protein
MQQARQKHEQKTGLEAPEKILIGARQGKKRGHHHGHHGEPGSVDQ